jgi:integrase
MPHVVLTQTLVDGPLKPGEYFDLALPDFGLRVGADKRVFYVRVREGHKRVRLALGQAGAGHGRLRVKDARKRAGELLSAHGDGALLKPAATGDAGLDPVKATVAELAAAYNAERGANWSPNWLRQCRTFETMLGKSLGHVRARELSRHQLKTVVRKYAARAPVHANRYHAFLGALCRWAVNEEILDRNPIDQLDRPTIEESRDRELSADELVELWRALDIIDADPDAKPRERIAAALYRLRLLTAQRDTPWRKCEWAWVDLDKAIVDFPAHVMKGRKGSRLPHVVPLAARALALLTARRALASPADRLVFGVHAGTTKPPTRPRSRLRGVELVDFQGKDLRRTAATLMAEHGVTDFVIARVLAHKRKGDVITGIYNRYEYLAEKRVALDTLDRVLTGILEPAAATSAPVLPFQRA